MIRNFFYTIFALIVLTTLVISSCKQEEAPEVDPTTLPVSSFFVDNIAYKQHLENGSYTTYAHVTIKNSSSYSNRWKWQRPGSRELFDGIYRPVEFMTKKQDTIITQVYLATDAEQIFRITLTAYSDNPIGITPDSIVIYETFESRPFTQEIKIKK